VTITCRHRLAVAETQFDALFMACVICGYQTVRRRCIGVGVDSIRCPSPAEPEYETCERHAREEPPRWGPVR
jgi:hypothetical protein